MTENDIRNATKDRRIQDEELLPLSPQLPLILDSPEESPGEAEEETVAYQPIRLILPGYTYEEERPRKGTSSESLHDLSLDELPPPPQAQCRPLTAIGHAFAGNFFHRGDAPAEWGRKGIFWLSLLTLLLSLMYALYALWLSPMVNTRRYDKVASLYQGQTAGGIASGEAYPVGMRAAFSKLYDINPDVRGFVEYHAAGKEDFLDIAYPILYSGDNETYLTRDFFGKRNRNGALFFDKRSSLNTADANNKTLIVYGRNGLGGQMLSGLNRLVGNVNNARVAATLTMSTLYEENTYHVFAVVLTDENETGTVAFHARRTSFSSDEDFVAYVEAVRARSLFDYPVEVTAEDELLVLTTNASPSVSKLANGRITVFARLATPDSFLNTSAIVKNDDVIMPMSWYLEQGLTMHPYYETVDDLPGDTTASTTSSTTQEETDPTELQGEPSDTAGSSTSAISAGTTARPKATTTRKPKTTTTTTTTATATTTTTTAEQTPADPPAETPADPPAESPADPPAESPADPPAEEPGDHPVESPAEPPAEEPEDIPAEPTPPVDPNGNTEE